MHILSYLIDFQSPPIPNWTQLLLLVPIDTIIIIIITAITTPPDTVQQNHHQYHPLPNGWYYHLVQQR